MTEAIWTPQAGPQAMLVNCPVAEIMYGGARGGGKTDGMIGKNAIKADHWGADQKGIFFRRELPQLEEAIARCQEIYLPLGWKWAEQKKTFTSPKGATLKFRALERDSDAGKYQGQQYTDMYFEELTNWASPKPINRLRGSLRSPHGVPCQLHATCNPGGPGHQWVKARYIDPHPGGLKILKEQLPNGNAHERIFIPAKLTDNKILTENDPQYESNLYMVGSTELVRAWLEGDWNVVEGAFFDCWSPKMILEPHEVPAEALRFRSFDWGYARPFSVGWWYVNPDDTILQGRRIPRGAMVRYREWYGCTNEPNVGLRLTAEEVADGILRSEEGDEINYGVADPAIFAEDGGPSIAERMMRRGVYWKKADNKRIARAGQAGGWDAMRGRMIGFDEEPMIYVVNTCAASIRTIPDLQHDPNRAEDLDTSAEDHAADEWRYACMSRPWVAVPKRDEPQHRDLWGRVNAPSSWKVM